MKKMEEKEGERNMAGEKKTRKKCVWKVSEEKGREMREKKERREMRE
jgi:hypothetical protein